jgi:hypothetical protein
MRHHVAAMSRQPDFLNGLRNFTASTLMSTCVEDNIISLMTGDKSRELCRYQHLRVELKRTTVDLIAGVLKEADETVRLVHACFTRIVGRPNPQS